MMETFKNQVRQIFKDAISCKNCSYRDEDGFCNRINDLFHVELRVDEKSECGNQYIASLTTKKLARLISVGA